MYELHDQYYYVSGSGLSWGTGVLYTEYPKNWIASNIRPRPKWRYFNFKYDYFLVKIKPRAHGSDISTHLFGNFFENKEIVN